MIRHEGSQVNGDWGPIQGVGIQGAEFGSSCEGQVKPSQPWSLLSVALVRDVSFKSCYGGCYTELEVEKTVVKRGGRMYSGPDNKLVILLPRENPYHTLLQYASPSLKRTISAYKSIWNCAKVYDFFLVFYANTLSFLLSICSHLSYSRTLGKTFF